VGGECAADPFRGTGQQHTNRDCKETSQEYLVNSVSQLSLLGPFVFVILSRPRLCLTPTAFIG